MSNDAICQGGGGIGNTPPPRLLGISARGEISKNSNTLPPITEGSPGAEKGEEEPGNIILPERPDWQWKIIDECCDTLYDEFDDWGDELEYNDPRWRKGQQSLVRALSHLYCSEGQDLGNICTEARRKLRGGMFSKCLKFESENDSKGRDGIN